MAGFEAFLQKIQAGTDLTEAESEQAISLIMQGDFSTDQVKQFLLSLKQKGEALSEVVGAARAMRSKAIQVRSATQVVDTCGTGGDGLMTANISTLAALVVAGAGVAVAKHGNRSISSSCGSADLLEALGVKVDVEPQVAERCLQQAGFAFLFAPRFHPAMKAVAPIRKELGVPTIFNLLGPLTNPAGAKHQVVGVAKEENMELYARALQSLGVVRALVVHGADGQDEISTTGLTQIIEFNIKMDPEKLARYTVTPEQFAIRCATLAELKGGSPLVNAQIGAELLKGKQSAVRDAVLLNAAAALYVSGASGDMDNGLTLARQSLDSGKAAAVLEKVKTLTHE